MGQHGESMNEAEETPPFWLQYAADLEFQFNPQATVPSFRDEFAKRRALSVAAVGRMNATLDVRYAAGPRQTLDVFHGDVGAPAVLYFHGGFWRMGDKSNQSLLAEPFCRMGFPVVMANYDLCPEVGLGEIRRQAEEAAAWVFRNEAVLGPSAGRRMLVAGHSAGAYLAAHLLTIDWSDRLGRAVCPLIGAGLFTGIYDLGPVPGLSVNRELRLSSDAAAALSLLDSPPARPVPVITLVGGDETPGWRHQSVAYALSCVRAGCLVEHYEIPGENHHSLAIGQASPEHLVTRRLLELLRAARDRDAADRIPLSESIA